MPLKNQDKNLLPEECFSLGKEFQRLATLKKRKLPTKNLLTLILPPLSDNSREIEPIITLTPQ